MRVVKYSLLKDEDGKPSLVKESATNYPSLIKKVDTPLKVADLLNAVYSANRLPEEHAWLIALNQQLNVIGVLEVSHGACNGTYMNPRETFWRLCMCGASAFFVSHNHPSGNPSPSGEDDETTKKLMECGNLMGIRMLDHIIIGADSSYYSYHEAEKIWF